MSDANPSRLEPFRLSNRKYLGSKKDLAEALLDRIVALAGRPAGLLDGFSGTGAITACARRRGIGRIVSVDNLYSNWVIQKGFFQPTERAGRLAARIDALNELPPRSGYISLHFAGLYFTAENCGRMDAVREEIERLRACGAIDRDEHLALLASFLLAADRVANTVGQYDAYLKHMGRRAHAGGRHLVDERVYSPFRLRPLALLGALEGQVLHADLLEAVGGIDAEVAYFDPPYNGRQYCDNYHLLENLALWRKPPLAGKTKKFPRAHLKSPFSRRREVRPAFQRLLRRTRARHVFLSYNSEGLLSRQELADLLGAFGRVACFDFSYPVFGRGAGVSRKRSVTEYLFYLEKAGGGEVGDGRAG